jgi:hypothetical protein
LALSLNGKAHINRQKLNSGNEEIKYFRKLSHGINIPQDCSALCGYACELTGYTR